MTRALMQSDFRLRTLAALEPLDTQSAELTQFLKAKGIASEEELAPYFFMVPRSFESVIL